MRRTQQFFASVFLSAALMAPIGAMAILAPQDDHERHEREEREEHERRVYDPDYRDYHNWDAREDETYRHWLEEKHRSYVEYDRLDARRQREYWKWRHRHEEHEEHEEHENH